jgi:hypothetical protein
MAGHTRFGGIDVSNLRRLARTGLIAVTTVVALTITPAVTVHADTVIGTRHRDGLSDTGRADVIRAKAGRDNIFMMHNHDRRRDRVYCGRGFDRVWVNFGPDMRGRVDRRDVFRGCERIRAYSP